MNDVEEKFAQLKPVLGKRINPLWLAYSNGSRVEKQEIEGIVDCFRLRLLNETFTQEDILLDPPSKKVSWGSYKLGQICYGTDRSSWPFGLREDDWIQHIGIFGRSGAGKTNLVFLVIWNLLKQKKPFLIFDWKRNYRDLLAFYKNIQVFTVGRNIVPFHFNPLIPPKGTHPKIWLKKIIEVISHAYFTGEGVQHIFQKCIDHVYRDFGVYKKGKADFPTFKDIEAYFYSTKAKGYRQSLWMDSTMRVLSSLNFGSMDSVVNSHQPNNIYALLRNNVILELDSLSEADKTFFIESLLLWIHHYRLHEGSREQFKHCTIIEEAHHILLKKKQETTGGETITDLILREIRELGESLVIVDQHPSLISLPAMGNTNTTIAFNLKHQADISTAANAMSFTKDKEHFIGQLPVGHAMVKHQSRYPKPFLLKVPLAKIRKGVISNSDIAAHQKRYSAYSSQHSATSHEKKQLKPIPSVDRYSSERPETNLLLDIYKKPFNSIVKRYERLGLSGRQGSKYQAYLIDQRLVEPIVIATKRGRLKLFQITGIGYSVLSRRGISCRKFHPGVEHEYWKWIVSKHFRDKGYLVETDQKIINGFAVDILVSKRKERIAIEIETGKSDYILNLKNAVRKKFTRILSLATKPQTLATIQNSMFRHKLSDPRIELKLAKDFS
jgi:Helicase HerA, central domain